MPLSRRRFLSRTTLSACFLPLLRPSTSGVAGSPRVQPLVKPPRLRPGGTVGLISPGGYVDSFRDVQYAEHMLAKLGLNTRRGQHVLDRRGYLAGADADRAADVNRMFADPEVDAILAMRGGWGSARILPLIDYDLIRARPKILVGFSDLTSLLIAIYVKSGLVTFHGPVGISSWNDLTVDYFRRVLFDGEAVLMTPPVPECCVPAPDAVGPRTITPGRAEGRLIGGNLTVLASIIGSGYLPDWGGHLLFLEETHEEPYRIDRMLAQLELAGVLDQISGFIFGQCTDCEPDEDFESLTLEEVLDDYIAPLGIPAWAGAAIGHIADKFTLPIGIEARTDAAEGTIQLLEPAVR